MSRNAMIGLVVVVLVILGGWYYIKSQKGASYTQPPIPQANPTETSASPSASPSETMGKNVVKITSSGFMSQNLTVKVGDSVTWMNGDSENHTVNSNPHPVHTDYPPLNLGVIKPGESKSLIFPTAGTFKYHDHLNPSLTGSVTVQ